MRSLGRVIGQAAEMGVGGVGEEAVAKERGLIVSPEGINDSPGAPRTFNCQVPRIGEIIRSFAKIVSTEDDGGPPARVIGHCMA